MAHAHEAGEADGAAVDEGDAPPPAQDAELGVFRVRSGSTEKGSNGYAYNEW